MFEEDYKTIETPTSGEYRDRGSRFLGYAFPVKNEKEVKEIVNKIKKDHPKANHHCYAFRLGPSKSAFRFSDDREPSGSAGKPIYGVIQSADLTDILIVVVRYFGGTLLGVNGLINAYRSAAKEAVNQNVIVTKPIVENYLLEFEYENINEVMSIIKQTKANVVNQDLNEKCSIRVELPKHHADEFLKKINTSHILKGTVKIEIL
ncbi:MAG TPA: YigZ family protein [Bacteroidia bacterium]|nr:YigZ family protein [Bacteroidia bacterium]